MIASRRRQRGAAFYLLIVASATVLTMLTLGMSGLLGAAKGRGDDAQATLEETRAAVLAHLLQAHLPMTLIDGSAVPVAGQLGTLRLMPDLPVAAGPGLDAAEPVLDGFAEIAGCAFRGWAPGAALQSRAVQGAAARCFGRLPWREIGAAPRNADPQDAMGLVPWIIVSPNLVEPQGCAGPGTLCTPALSPMLLDQPFLAYGAPGRAQYPWIRIVDERGNLLSDRVAIAIVLPGPALGGQVRGGAAGPAAYLDRLTVAAGCPQPCVPGTYDNADYNHADNQPWTLIRGPVDPGAAAAKGFYGLPYDFNDRIAFITIDELIGAIEARARTAIVKRLRDFKTANNFLPWAGVADAGGNGQCTGGVRQGLLPVGNASCNPADWLDVAAGGVPAWFVNAGWHRYFRYAVSPVCVRGNNACAGVGLTVGAQTNIDALLLSPGIAITTPPFAATRGMAQAPIAGITLSLNLADWLDDPANVDGDDVFVLPATTTSASNDRLHLVSP